MGSEVRGGAPVLVPASDYDGFSLCEWMWSPDGLGLSLSSLDLMVYAKVYSVSHHNTGAMTASQPKLAQLLGVARESVNRSLRRLVDSGLVYVCGSVRGPGQGGRPVNVYAVCQAPIERAMAGCRSTRESNQLSEGAGVFDSPASADVTEESRPSGEGEVDVTRESPSNVTPESNVTCGSRSETGSLTCDDDGFSTEPPLSLSTVPVTEREMQDELGETEQLAFERLLGLSLKPVPDRYVGEARALFCRCLREGIAPEVILGAYGDYARKLVAQKREGGGYRPMSLTHFLMRREDRSGRLRHNGWIEEAVARAAAEETARGAGTRFGKDVSSGRWVAIPSSGSAAYVPGVGPDASLGEAKEAWARHRRGPAHEVERR